MKLKAFFFLLTFLLVYAYAYAQGGKKPAYIVKNESDTIYGKGIMNKSQEFAFFKAHGEEKSKKIYPYAVSAFRIIDGRYYITRKVERPSGNEKWYFLEYLVDGELDLFTIHYEDRYFIEAEGRPLLELDDSQKKEIVKDGEVYLKKDYTYLGYLRHYMRDAPQLFDKIDEMEDVDIRSLVELSEDYHDVVCDEYECTTYAAVVPKNSSRLGIVSGISRHNDYVTPYYGVLGHIWLPLRNVNLFINTGFLYAEASAFKKSRRYPEKRFTVKVPFSFQYVFGDGPVKPTLAFGYPTGIYFVSSVQGGMLISLNQALQVNLTASLEAPMTVLTGELPYSLDNSLPYTLGVALFYRFD